MPLTRQRTSRATSDGAPAACSITAAVSAFSPGTPKRRMPGAQIDGLDVSQESLDRADQALLSQGVFTSHLSKLGRDYEVVVIANVLHHVKPGERQNLISEAGSRLARGGRLVIFEHNPANPLTRWAVDHCPFDEDAILLPPRETTRYVQGARLRLLTRDYIVFFPRWLAPFRPLEARLRWCPLGAQYAVVGAS